MEPKTARFHTVFPELSEEQTACLTALLEGNTVNDAAMIADVNRSTVFRWLKEPAFQAALRQSKAEALETVSRKLLRLGVKAVDTLEGILDNSQSENVKVRAAVDSLTQLFKSYETITLKEEIEAVREQIAALQDSNDGSA